MSPIGSIFCPPGVIPPTQPINIPKYCHRRPTSPRRIFRGAADMIPRDACGEILKLYSSTIDLEQPVSPHAKTTAPATRNSATGYLYPQSSKVLSATIALPPMAATERQKRRGQPLGKKPPSQEDGNTSTPTVSCMTRPLTARGKTPTAQLSKPPHRGLYGASAVVLLEDPHGAVDRVVYLRRHLKSNMTSQVATRYDMIRHMHATSRRRNGRQPYCRQRPG